MFPAKLDLPLTGLDWLEYYGKHNVYHPALDINSGIGDDDLGNNIHCPAHGFVEYVYTSWNHRGFGNFVIILHDDGNYTRYAHMNDIDNSIKRGVEVMRGQLLGHVGNTGTVYAHLHFEVFKPSMLSIQKKHFYSYRYYPSGKSKQYVIEHYINPWEWLQSMSPEKWREDAEKWAAKYIKDMPEFLAEVDLHKIIELVRRAKEDTKK